MTVPIRLPLSSNPHHILCNSGPHFKWIYFRWAFSGVRSPWANQQGLHSEAPEEGWVTAFMPGMWRRNISYNCLIFTGADIPHVTTGSLLFYPLTKLMRTEWRKSLCLVCLLPLFPAASLGPDTTGQNTQLHTLDILRGWASQSTLGHC